MGGKQLCNKTRTWMSNLRSFMARLPYFTFRSYILRSLAFVSYLPVTRCKLRNVSLVDNVNFKSNHSITFVSFDFLSDVERVCPSLMRCWIHDTALFLLDIVQETNVIVPTKQHDSPSNPVHSNHLPLHTRSMPCPTLTFPPHPSSH